MDCKAHNYSTRVPRCCYSDSSDRPAVRVGASDLITRASYRRLAVKEEDTRRVSIERRVDRLTVLLFVLSSEEPRPKAKGVATRRAD